MSETPRTVWEGSFCIFGVTLKCSVLDDGRRIIDADDFDLLMHSMHAPDNNDAELGDLAAFNRWRMGGE